MRASAGATSTSPPPPQPFQLPPGLSASRKSCPTCASADGSARLPVCMKCADSPFVSELELHPPCSSQEDKIFSEHPTSSQLSTSNCCCLMGLHCESDFALLLRRKFRENKRDKDPNSNSSLIRNTTNRPRAEFSTESAGNFVAFPLPGALPLESCIHKIRDHRERFAV